MIIRVIFSLIVMLVFLAACQTAPSIKVEDLSGTWQKDGVDTVIQFNEDGIYRIADSEFVLEDRVLEIGQFQFEGTLLTFTTGDESPFCRGLKGIYNVELTEEDQLHFTLDEDECIYRRGDLPTAAWSRISP